jgi:hypothetical protein
VNPPRSLDDLFDDLATAERAVRSVKERLGSAPRVMQGVGAALTEDKSAYRPATEFLAIPRFKTYRRLLAVLKANPSIRTDKPSRFRRTIHAGDLIAYVARMNVADFEAADGNVSTAAHLTDEVGRARTARLKSAR